MASEPKSKSSASAISTSQYPQVGKPGSVSAAFSEAKDVGRRNAGLLLVVASQAFFSMMTTTVKVLHGIDPPISTFQLVWVRSVITYACCLAYIYLAKIPNPLLGPEGVRLLLLCRGMGGFVAFFGSCSALRYLSLSDATVLTFLAPMTTAVAGSVFLEERFTVGEALAGVISLGGVVLIARPTAIFGSHDLPETSDPEGVTPAQRLLAVGAALIGVLGLTLTYTMIRAIGKRAHAMHTMMYFAMSSILCTSLSMLVSKTQFIMPSGEALTLLFMIGFFGFFGQILLTMGIQRETASRGTMAIYTLVVWAMIFERVVFHTVPTRLSVIGTLLIVCSAIYIALTKQKEPVASLSIIDTIPSVSTSGVMEEGLISSSEDASKITNYGSTRS